MIQALLAFIPFLREVIFGYKPDHGKKKKTNTFTRYLIYAVVVASLAGNYNSVKKIYTLTISVVRLKEQNKQIDDLKTKLQKSEAKVEELEKVISDHITRKSR